MKIGIFYNLSTKLERGTANDFLADNEILQTVDMVANVLQTQHDVVKVPVSAELLQSLRPDSFDIIFNLCEGLNNNPMGEAWFAGLYDILGLAYTGSDSKAMGMCLDKILAKQVMHMNDILTPQYQLFSKAQQQKNPKLTFPLIVKPVREDASIGIDMDSVVNTEKDLRNKIKYILDIYKQPALVEEFIEGRELNIAIMGNEDDIEVLPISEIEFNFEKGIPKIVTFEAKWMPESDYYKNTNGICPAKLDKKIEEKIKIIAKKVYQLFNCRDYARVDIRLRGEEVFVLEVNPNPGINVDSGFYRSIKKAGLTYDEFIQRILNLALKRYKKTVSFSTKNMATTTKLLKVDQVKMEDVAILSEWFNDRENTAFMENSEHIFCPKDLIYKFLVAKDSDIGFMFYEKDTNKPIGYGAIYNINKINKTGEISFLIGDKNFHKKGYGKEIIQILVNYSFKELQLNSLIGYVTEKNIASRKALEYLGFVRVGELKQWHLHNEERLNDILYQKINVDIGSGG
jgi:D-alanine-D-alanine ligase